MSNFPPLPKIPKDHSELASIKIDFPRLNDDSPQSCPVPITDILEYLRFEAYPEGPTAKNLQFLRTAQVKDTKYWIWQFFESDGTKCYVTVSQDPKGSVTTGYEVDYYKLTPEQFILGEYYGPT